MQRLRCGLLQDSFFTGEQIAELRYLVDKCLKFKMLTNLEHKTLDTYLLKDNVFKDPRYLQVERELRATQEQLSDIRSKLPEVLRMLRTRVDKLQGAIMQQRRIRKFGDAISVGLTVVDVVLGPLASAPIRLATKVAQGLLSGAPLAALGSMLGVDQRLT